ncbi:hypothetical protein Snoj_39240 [Streptomyces nojiriensis]|uniref:Transposase n=1 Tax=Streptomyces nojiriensis TaxID=66374 RepID=A0ABQ3SPF6_9ACTN|nr:hypothetical protein GCM10010205_07890 [Streptomyces nojiriensis]GHI70006.1 hypothetical protein Snoj_39240 [Streptomyces nojiriensis]
MGEGFPLAVHDFGSYLATLMRCRSRPPLFRLVWKRQRASHPSGGTPRQDGEPRGPSRPRRKESALITTDVQCHGTVLVSVTGALDGDAGAELQRGLDRHLR